MNLISIVILAAAVIGFVAAIRHIKKKGCCSDCRNCSMKCGKNKQS